MLHSVIVAPQDLTDDRTALAITLITHAHRKGMSVLRGAASDDEFRYTLKQRIKKPGQTFHGVASFGCVHVRRIVAENTTAFRKQGDRLFHVLDTDMENLPHHADIFATVPKTDKPTNVWKSEREALLDLLVDGFTPSAEFRNGTIAP